MIPTDLLAMLRCPQSGQALVLAGPEILAPLNERISPMPQSGPGVCNQAGNPVDKVLTEALLSVDRRLLYPVRDGIPVLLTDEAIPL